MVRNFKTNLLVIAVSSLAVACGRTTLQDQGGSGEDGYSSLIFIENVSPGYICPEGGIAVHAGLDLDRNGNLDPEEITTTSYICNGENGIDGSDGRTTLVEIEDEPPGATCPAGGSLIKTGLDNNGNQELDPDEVTSTATVCNGQGGDQGPVTLFQVTDEPVGNNCEAGGKLLEWGRDLDEDGFLDADEIESSEYVCNGAEGRPPFLEMEPEPAGTNCGTGGTRLSFGYDLNDNGLLDDDEVVSVDYVCNGLPGEGLNSLVNVIPEPAGSNCTAGGQAIQNGLDENGDGLLQPGEIDNTTYVCNGTNGLDSLIRQEDESPGPNCPNGGRAVLSGLDLDGNGYLDDNEVQSTAYVCNGTDGADGHNSLFNTASVSPGNDCPTGGYLVTSGLDTNDNGVLDTSEVQASQYLCNGIAGEDGQDGLSTAIRITTEQPGAQCPNGGQKVQSGQDDNQNGSLDPSEVDQTWYICNGEQGDQGFVSLVEVSEEPAGGNCPAGGQRIDSGLDTNLNQNLDSFEITQTSYVCDGGNVVMRVSQALWGGACPRGGIKIETGIDDNANQVLDDGETDQTQYMCNSFPVQIAAGLYHTCALLSDGTNGTVRCWGRNNNGQLGDGSTDQRESPVAVSGLDNVTAISTGGLHTCALLTDGTARCWGYNASGQLGTGSTSPIQSELPQTVSGLSSAVSIAAGGEHTCALLSDESVVCWGKNSSGQLGDGTTAPHASPEPVPGLNNVVAISTGGYHSCAVRISGGNRQALCWGENDNGQLGDGTTTQREEPTVVPGLNNVGSISAGGYHTCGALTFNTAFCWGHNLTGQIGDGSTSQRTSPTPVFGMTTATAISAGGMHSCAVLGGNTAQCWGYNVNGQLGDGTDTLRVLPVDVVGLSSASSMSAGAYHTCALLADGTARCWGSNEFGQIGDGTLINRFAPTNAPIQ